MESESGTIRCTRCGADNHVGDQFCRSCGMTVSPVTVPTPPGPAGTYSNAAYVGSGYPAGAPPKTNSSAIVSLVTGIASILLCPLIGIVGIIAGIRARREIKASEGRETGEPLALAGIITSVIGLLFIGLIIFLIVVVTVLGQPASKFSSVGSAIRDVNLPAAVSTR